MSGLIYHSDATVRYFESAGKPHKKITRQI